ncbi:MAG: hypothetical protein ACLFR7_09990 [Opitutales bacterium]
MSDSTKKLAVEFTHGVRRELAFVASAFLFFKTDAENGLEPVLLGETAPIEVSDTTQELSAEAQTINVRTAAAASVATLADGLFLGQRLAVRLDALGTAGDALTLTSDTGIEDAAGDALASLGFDEAEEFAILDWVGDAWRVVNATATETA